MTAEIRRGTLGIGHTPRVPQAERECPYCHRRFTPPPVSRNKKYCTPAHEEAAREARNRQKRLEPRPPAYRPMWIDRHSAGRGHACGFAGWDE